MNNEKPKVIAFYRDHPTLKAIADDMQAQKAGVQEQLDFLAKRYNQMKADMEKALNAKLKQLGAEVDRLGLAPGEKIEETHFHVDFETMTIQRCNHHGLGELLGFLR